MLLLTFNNLFESKVRNILAPAKIDEAEKDEMAKKITFAFEMIVESMLISHNSKKEPEDNNAVIGSLERKRNRTDIPRDTYFKVLSDLAQEMKNKGEIIPTIELKNRFRERIKKIIEASFANDNDKLELSLKSFEFGALNLSIRKSTVNDKLRKNLLGNSNSIAVKKWDLFILTDKKGNVYNDTQERIEWRNQYIKAFI